MNSINFMLFGVPASHDRFNVSFVQDQVKVRDHADANYQYEGNVKKIYDVNMGAPIYADSTFEKDKCYPNSQLSQIDNIVEVITVDSLTRKNEQNFWKYKHVLPVLLGYTSAFSALSGSLVGAGLLMAAATVGLVGLVTIAAAVATVAIGLFVVAGVGAAGAAFCFYRAHQADKQMKAWADPTETYVEQRRKGGDSFETIYKNQLKGKVFHEDEVKEIFKKQALKICMDFPDSPHNISTFDVERIKQTQKSIAKGKEYAGTEMSEEGQKYHDRMIANVNTDIVAAMLRRPRFQHRVRGL